MPNAKHYLDRAALLALRAAGDAEPNPLVGAVIVRDGRVIGLGHHHKFGSLHAEAEALADCARRGESTKGATVYVTLEPCTHTGKQPPCTQALINARVARVVIARPDPNPLAAGGAEVLRRAGIAAEFTSVSPLATSVADVFARRIATGMPWVIAKWAQTIDGRIATRTGQSQWISCESSRRRVHRLRARVDAVLTAIGTVRADNPQLTARNVARVRRVARRILIDARAELPLTSALIATLDRAPLTLVHDQSLTAANHPPLAHLAALGVDLLPARTLNGKVDLREALRAVATRHSLTNILVEAGPGLIGALLRDDLIDEAHVYIAPMLLGDELAKPAATGHVAPSLADAQRFALAAHRRSGNDALLVFRRTNSEQLT